MAARKKKTTHRKKTTRRHTKAKHPNDRPHDVGGRFAKAVVVGAAPLQRLGTESADGSAEVAALVDRVANETPLAELGSTGLRHYAGTIDEEFLPQLRGTRQIRVFQEMRDNDPTIGAMFFAVEMLMRQVRWTVEPGTPDQSDVELADFVNSARLDMADTWEDTLASIFSFLTFGFSIHEEVYKRRDGDNPNDPTRHSIHSDGRIGWRKLPVRAQDTVHRWIFNPETDEVDGMVQLPPPDFRFRTIPAAKYLLFRTTAAKANPQGRSVLRNAYRPWYFKRRVEEIEGIGIERDLAGLPMMGVPARIMSKDAKPEEKALYAEIRNMLRDVRRDEREGIIVPRAWDKDDHELYSFSLVRSGGRRQFDTTTIVNRYDRQIASVALADFILLGQQRVGSYALADSKTELFGVALGAWLDTVTAQFNRVGIPRLLRINGIERDKPPRLVHGDVEVVDLTEIGEYVSKLTGAGMPLFPDDDVENMLRAQGGLPEKPEGEAGAVPPGQLTPEMIAELTGREVGADPPAPGSEGERVIDAAEDVEASKFNGAQVTAIVDLATKVATNELGRDSAIAILGVAFNLDPGKANEILGAAREVDPTPPTPPTPPEPGPEA
jgi:hypothetical protein